MTLFIIKEVTDYSVTIYRTLLLFLDLDHFIISIIVLLASKSLVCIDFPVAVSSYTSLGHSIKSKSYASVRKSL
jgi:hypothetical protein